MKYQEAWFNNYEKETEIYAREKANKDIHNNSAPEYIKCEIKYINEEKERQQLYLNQQYHSKINDINSLKNRVFSPRQKILWPKVTKPKWPFSLNFVL